jgi:hypothetical protein
MAVASVDFSCANTGEPVGWRVRRGDLSRFEIVGPEGERALRVGTLGPGKGSRHIAWESRAWESRAWEPHAGEPHAREPNQAVRQAQGPMAGGFDLRVRFRWLQRGADYSFLVGDGAGICGGFRTVRSSPPRRAPYGLGRAAYRGLRSLASRTLAHLRVGGRRPAPAGKRSLRKVPQPMPRVTLEGGGRNSSRPFGTPGSRVGAREPRVGEWLWIRLSREGGRVAVRFWRDGYVEPADPWLEVDGSPLAGAGPAVDPGSAAGSASAVGSGSPGFFLLDEGQELEIDWVGVGTGGDPAPFPDGPGKAAGPPAAWYDPRWTRRKRIVMPKAHFRDLDGPLEGFPLFVSLSGDAAVRDAARGDGGDILFTAADGVTRLPHERATHRRLLREQGVWTVWSDPRGLRHVGARDRTYVTYYTTNRGWWISALDHETGEWEDHRLRSHEASGSGRWWDDHNNPSVTVRADGHLVVAYNEHSTPRGWVRISERPEDISLWGPEIPMTSEQEAGEADPRYSYADLYALPDGTLWRKYRPRDGYGISRPATFVTSRDGGKSWSAPVRFFEVPTRTPYVVTALRGNRIDFFCSEAHPNEYHQTSIFHFYYDHSAGTYHRSDGGLIGDRASLPVGPDRATLVHDGTTPAGEGWVHGIASDGKGGVAGLYVAYAGEKHGLPDSALVHEYWYARWNGRAWERHHLATDRGRLDAHANQRYYAGGGVVDPEDLDVVYLSLVDPTEGASHSRHLFRYQTADGGRTWRRERVTRGEGRGASRPFVPRNRHPSLPVLWLHGDYVNYYEYWTALAAGNGVGPVLESEHYVRVPIIRPDEDLVLHVYYGNPEAPDQEDPDGVWPAALRFRHRGSLGVQRLGPIDLGGPQALTVEVHASLATRRQVDPAVGQALLSNRVGSERDGLLLRRRGGSFTPELLLAVGGRESLLHFEDLPLEVRDHLLPDDPPRASFLTVRLDPVGGVNAWLNGIRSGVEGTMPGPFAGSSSPGDLWSCASPHDPTAPPWTGWIRSLRIHAGALSDAWISLAQRAETDPDFAARLEEESVGPVASRAPS